MTAMCATAMWARRSNYELFLYTHHLAIGVFVTVIIHAWSAWFFLAPPLLFWALDKCLRAARTRAVTALALHCGCGDITRLVLPARALSTYTPAAHAGRSESGDDDSEAGTHHFAGAHCWVAIVVGVASTLVLPSVKRLKAHLIYLSRVAIFFDPRSMGMAQHTCHCASAVAPVLNLVATRGACAHAAHSRHGRERALIHAPSRCARRRVCTEWQRSAAESRSFDRWPVRPLS